MLCSKMPVCEISGGSVTFITNRQICVDLLCFTKLICMSTFGTIAFAVVMLHLLVGFGYVVYKLRPMGKGNEDPKPQ